MRDPADRRQKIALGILGVDARLDGVPVEFERILRERQRLARGDAELPLDQVEPGDHFGDRMLDLQARIHLHEVERAVAVDDELDRAGTDVADRLRGARPPPRPSLARRSRVMPGAGASSRTFWWRR